MPLYADSSALVKRYLNEDGSAFVREIWSENPNIYVSSLTHLEAVSAIEFAKRIRRINTPLYRIAINLMEADFKSDSLIPLNMDPSVLKEAGSLIRVRYLRPPDAIQLATALEVKKRLGKVDFMCADHDLLHAAKLEGLKCVDVSK